MGWGKKDINILGIQEKIQFLGGKLQKFVHGIGFFV